MVYSTKSPKSVGPSCGTHSGRKRSSATAKSRSWIKVRSMSSVWEFKVPNVTELPWLYSLATRKLLAWVCKAVGHLLLENAKPCNHPVWGHESESTRFWYQTSNKRRIQTGSALHLGLKRNTEEINDNQRALKIMEKHASFGKTVQGTVWSCSTAPCTISSTICPAGLISSEQSNPLGFSCSPWNLRQKDPEGSRIQRTWFQLLFSSWGDPRCSDGASALSREEDASFSGFLSGKPWEHTVRLFKAPDI